MDVSQPAESELSGDNLLKALRKAISDADVASATQVLDQIEATNQSWTLARVSESKLQELVTLVSADQAADVLVGLPDALATDVIEDLDAHQAATILDELELPQKIRVFEELSQSNSDAILHELPAQDAQDIRLAMSFSEDEVGHTIDQDYLSFNQRKTIGQVLDDIRSNAEEYSDLEIQYSYVVDDNGHLRGVLNLRNLLMRPPSTLLENVMIPNPTTLDGNDHLHEAISLFQTKDWLAVPVTDADGRMLGLAKRSTIEALETKNQSLALLRRSGIVGGDELRSMPFGQRSYRRLSWLSANIVLNLFAAAIIASYEQTLAQVIALAAFLPMISDMSGCSGNQAVAVSMRELSLGTTKPSQIMYVVYKESTIGIVNGLILGTLLGGIAGVWKSNLYLGLVVGTALSVNTVIACTFGGLVPLLLTKLKQDPALAASPLLTTITDMCGFLLVFSLATSFMHLLI